MDSVDLVRNRFLFLRELRTALVKRGYLEVDTPVLLPEVATDPFVDPVTAELQAGGRTRRLYLRTSPEFEMKRLVVLGFEAVFEIAHVFRGGDYSKVHNPEFCMAEWYRRGWSYLDLMAELDGLLAELFRGGAHCRASIPWTEPTPRRSIDDVFLASVGFTVTDLQESDALFEMALRRGLVDSTSPRDFSQVFSWLWVQHIDGHLEGLETALFLVDWPLALGELASVNPDNPVLAQRFELVYRGIELANGYQELTDAAECLDRCERDLQVRAREGLQQFPRPDQFASEVCGRLPMCSGLSLGVDRLAMLALGRESVHDVLAWSFDAVEGMSR